jgi:hypothetical protein
MGYAMTRHESARRWSLQPVGKTEPQLFAIKKVRTMSFAIMSFVSSEFLEGAKNGADQDRIISVSLIRRTPYVAWHMRWL